MAIHPSKLGRIAVAKQSAWGTKQTSFPSSTFAEVEVVMPDLAREALMTEAYRGMFHSHRIKAGSREGATMSLRMPLHGYSASTPTGDPTSSDQTVESVLLEYAMGAVLFNTATGNTVGAYSDPTLTLAAAAASEVGTAIMAKTSSSETQHSIGFIKAQSGTDDKVLTLTSNLANAAIVGQPVYGSITHFISSNQPAQGLSVEYMGADSTSRIILFDGCVGSLKITISPREQPMLEAELHFADFELLGTGGNPGQYTFPQPQLPAAIGSNGTRMMINGVAVDSISAEFEVACEYVAVGNHSSSEGVSKYIISDRTVTLNVTTPASSINDSAVHAPGVELDFLQIDLNANVPGQAAALLIPKAIVMEQSTIGDSDGIVAITSTFGAAYYDSDASDGSITTGSGTTTAADTVARVALL